jgi:lambda family phage minor tail protein L
MAEEGKNKVASSLLDLQPTAILELFKVYPDRINNPSLFAGFHGGAIFDKSIKWQGIEYLPLAMESEGFDILGDGKLARPKIRVANVNNIITNLLQNHKDFKNAKVVRKKVQVKFLDDDNFDGGNPFGIADSKAELLDEEWIMGRKTQESKVFVEFELNSPLDLENFSVNSRGIQAKFCYWQYRGEGCRYQGLPIEQEDGTPFRNTDDKTVLPQYSPPLNDDGVSARSNFFDDPSVVWNDCKEYVSGDIVIVESPTILLSPYGGDVNAPKVPLKTVYVSVAGWEGSFNLGNHPEKNPSYWRKDGCTKKLDACQKRFNTAAKAEFLGTTEAAETFPTVKFSGASEGDVDYIKNSGLFHTTSPDVTGALDPTGEWTLVGWANMNYLSPRGAGIFSTSQGDGDGFPAGRFVNINRNSTWADRDTDKSNDIQAQYLGFNLGLEDGGRQPNPEGGDFGSPHRTNFLSNLQQAGAGKEKWHQFIIRHRTGSANFIREDRDTLGTTVIEFYVDRTLRDMISHRPIQLGNDPEDGIFPLDQEHMALVHNLGNFGAFPARANATWDDSKKMLPETFMIGAQEFFRELDYYPDNGPSYISTMNGHIGMWGLWNRALKGEEMDFLRKAIVAPFNTTNNFNHIPRKYDQCIGKMSTLTGGTGWSDPAGEVVPEGTAPFLYGENSLVAWWDGTTGDASIGNGLLDIHTGGNHLTGSGDFSGVAKTYEEAFLHTIDNPTPSNPRFGGFPGTDGFSYGRDGGVF